jgi:hypothetical protein
VTSRCALAGPRAYPRPTRGEACSTEAGLDIRRRRGFPVEHDGRPKPIQTTRNGQANQVLAGAWALRDRAEHLAREAVGADPGPSLWLLAAERSLRAGDVPKATNPVPPHADGVDPVPDDPCQHLVRAAVCELASIPAGQRTEGLSPALVHVDQCPCGVCRRSCS